MPAYHSDRTKHPAPHQLSIAFIKIFLASLFYANDFLTPVFKPPPYGHKKTPQSHSFTGHKCLKENVWMRERNIWRGRRVPGETRQDSPLRIVNHPPAVDGLRLAVLQDCRNFASLPVTSGALRFNNRRYRNVVDFSCKFSCILQVCRQFLTSGPLRAVPW